LNAWEENLEMGVEERTGTTGESARGAADRRLAATRATESVLRGGCYSDPLAARHGGCLDTARGNHTQGSLNRMQAGLDGSQRVAAWMPLSFSLSIPDLSCNTGQRWCSQQQLHRLVYDEEVGASAVLRPHADMKKPLSR
jgi:hypothetical protein